MKLPLTPGSYEPGSMEMKAISHKSGSQLPVFEVEKCTDCLACWIFCPDSGIERSGQGVRFKLDHCKGCGICATECPEGAITMREVA